MRTVFLVVIVLARVYCQGNVGQTLAGALFNTFFPQIKQNLLNPDTGPSLGPPHGLSPFVYGGSPAGRAPAIAPVPSFAIDSVPATAHFSPASSAVPPMPMALTGLGRLPPVDFPHGFPPTFVGLTNPENQKGFGMPTGLQGRTDLSPNYVYPFAAPGSVIQPDINNGEVFSLGQTAVGGGLTGLRRSDVPVYAGPMVSVRAPSIPTSPQPVIPIEQEDRCADCASVDLNKMAGPWIQVYGHPRSLRYIYTALQSTPVQPTCVGMQIGRARSDGGNRSEAAFGLYFRDDAANRELHEVGGVLQHNSSDPSKNVVFKWANFQLPMCLVKGGPETSTMYSYLVMTETNGPDPCRSYHVFARRQDSFDRDHNPQVAQLIAQRVRVNSALPVAPLPNPELCQLPPVQPTRYS